MNGYEIYPALRLQAPVDKFSLEYLYSGWTVYGCLLATNPDPSRTDRYIITHGGEDGDLPNVNIVRRYIAAHPDVHVWIICCYPRRVARRFPDLAGHILLSYHDALLYFKGEGEYFYIYKVDPNGYAASLGVTEILDVYRHTNEYDRSHGRGWYQSALLECKALAERYDIDIERIVYAVAALSPQLRWEKNISAARDVLDGAPTVPGVYTANVEKAWHILYDPSDWKRWLSGPKVRSFAANILGSPMHVTVDTWAWRVWTGGGVWEKPPAIDRLYDAIADDYRSAADRVGLQPRQLQAITWVSIRRIANGHAAPGQLSFEI